MSGAGEWSEERLEAIERSADPAAIPELVRAIRQLTHELDRLRLGLDVARRDREELRDALLRTRAALGPDPGATKKRPGE